MGAIVDIQIGRLQKLLDERKLVLDLEPDARDWLAEKGYDPAYGARPLKRVIQKYLQDPMAEAILSGAIKDGEEVVVRLGPSGLVIGDISVGECGGITPRRRTLELTSTNGRAEIPALSFFDARHRNPFSLGIRSLSVKTER